MSSVTVPVKVVLAEYLNVASAFFEDGSDELTFIGGVLHRVARDVRPAEPAAADPQVP
jgi:transcription termination factor NusB